MKHYKVTGEIDGQVEELYCSFLRSDCVYEKEAEKENWKEQGYKKIKIVSEEINEEPDEEVYGDNIVTKEEWFILQAPAMNFEMNAEELIEEAIERNILKHIKEDKYLIIDEDYQK